MPGPMGEALRKMLPPAKDPVGGFFVDDTKDGVPRHPRTGGYEWTLPTSDFGFNQMIDYGDLSPEEQDAKRASMARSPMMSQIMERWPQLAQDEKIHALRSLRGDFQAAARQPDTFEDAATYRDKYGDAYDLSKVPAGQRPAVGIILKSGGQAKARDFGAYRMAPSAYNPDAWWKR